MQSLISTTHRLLSTPLFWLVTVVCFTLLYFFLAHEGFYFGDDYSYSLYAYQLVHGGFHFDDYAFCHRFMVFVPTAFFYWLWGMNIYTTTLWPLLCTLGTLLLLFLSFRKAHPVATAWALVLLGLYYFQLNTVSYLYPDNILLFFTTTCLLVLYRCRHQLRSTQEQVLWGVAFAFLNLLAFLTKETIVYTVPFYLCLFLYHLLRRENLVFWSTAAFTGVVLLAAYFLLYKIYSGDALQRLYDIQATNTVETKGAYLESRAATLPTRLTYGPLIFFVGVGLAIPLSFAVLGFRGAFSHKWFALDRPKNFWTVAMLSMLLPIWFGTATVDFYKPMPLVPRMFHPLLPTFCISAGLALEQAWNRRKVFLLLAVLFTLFTFVAGGDMWVMYGPLAVFFTGLYLYNRPVPYWVGLGAVAAVLSIRPTYFMLKPTVSFYFEQKKIIDQHLSKGTGNYLVLTDTTMVRRHPFFYGFNVPENYRYRTYSTARASTLSGSQDTTFLLINNGVLEHPELMIQEKEKDILPIFPEAKLLAKDGKVKLYYLPNNGERLP